MALELRFLLFGVVMRVLGFLGICVGVLRDVTVLEILSTTPATRKMKPQRTIRSLLCDFRPYS